MKEAVRSLVMLSFVCYQRSACTLSPDTLSGTFSCANARGKTHLGSGFVLRCCQHFSFLDVAIQLWSGHPNWLTSGQAISVLSYWR